MAEGKPTPHAPSPGRRWAHIRDRMEAVAGALARQGSVAWRTTPGGTRVASVRYVEVVDGRRVQRSVYLGSDEDLAERAGDLIRRYRERERWAREIEEAARCVSACSALLRRTAPTTRGRPARSRGG